MFADLGVIDVVLTILSILLAVGASWVATREQLTAVSVKVDQCLADNAALKSELSTNVLKVSFMEGLNKRLEEDSAANKMILTSLTHTLGELNTTLGRFDERMKHVEDAVRAKQ